MFKNIINQYDRIKTQSEYFAKEIDALEIEKAGVNEENYGFIKLKNGPVFYSFNSPKKTHHFIYPKLSASTRKVLPKECMRCAIDIITRYHYPHMMVNSKPPFPREVRKHYHPQHFDTIDDFEMEDAEKEKLKKIFSLNKGDVIVDIGSHIGFGAMRIAKEVGPEGRVISFEADDPCYALLRKNLDANQVKNVTGIHMPIWSEKTTLTFNKSSEQQNSLLTGMIHKKTVAVEVAVDCIDNLLPEMGINQADFISYTINGAEPDALRGSAKMIAASPKVRISIAGWYFIKDQRIADIVKPILEEYGLKVVIGPTGKVLAYFENKW